MKIISKVFVVTGGASGLGEGTARMLAAHGGRVVIADLQRERGEALAREIGGVFVRHMTSARKPMPRPSSTGPPRSASCAASSTAPAERTVGRNGPHSLALFNRVIQANLAGSFNMIRWRHRP